jgi:nitrate/nitrite transporter NarK
MKEDHRTFSIALTFCIMFIFWVLLSAWTVYLPEPYDLTKISRGILAALIVTFLTYEIFAGSRLKDTPG